MKKTYKLITLISLFLIILSSAVFADDAEYILKKEFTFKNEKKYELTAGFVEISLGSFNFTQYNDDKSF